MAVREVTCRTLVETPLVRLGALCCPRDSPGWGDLNAIGALAHVAFPRTSAIIAQVGREPTLVNPNHVLFYEPYQEYRRSLVDPRGYTCVYLAVSVAVLDGLLVDLGVREGSRLPSAAGPSDAYSYLIQLLLTELLRAPVADRLFVEELASQLLATAVVGVRALSGKARPAGKARTRRAHVELVERTKYVLTLRMAERCSLEELGHELHTSPFHLARTFRAHTGYTLHGYRNQLRARRALAELLDTRVGMAALALRLGFCSLSHFSDSFHAVFGLRPSEVRRLATRPGCPELRTILEASRASLKEC